MPGGEGKKKKKNNEDKDDFMFMAARSVRRTSRKNKLFCRALFLCISPCLGYIEYSRMASCSAFKFLLPTPIFELRHSTWQNDILTSHPTAIT